MLMAVATAALARPPMQSFGALAESAPRHMRHEGILHARYADVSLMQADDPLGRCSERTEPTGSICLDSHGRVCRLCGEPLRTFDFYQDYIVRDDCGNRSDWSPDSTVPLASVIRPQGAGVLPPRAGPPTSWTNGWCEFNVQKAIADADANRDYFYYASTFVVRPGFAYDFSYCRHNGFVTDELAANLRNYDLLYNRSAELCTALDVEFNVHAISSVDFLKLVDPSADDPSSPNYDPNPPPMPAQKARALAAWACAMGGVGGDMAYCSYTYKDLGGGKFCQYPAGPGWTGTSFEGTADALAWACPRTAERSIA